MAGAGPCACSFPVWFLQWCSTAPWGKGNRGTALVSNIKKTLSLNVFHHAAPCAALPGGHWHDWRGAEGLFAAACSADPSATSFSCLACSNPLCLWCFLCLSLSFPAGRGVCCPVTTSPFLRLRKEILVLYQIGKTFKSLFFSSHSFRVAHWY